MRTSWMLTGILCWPATTWADPPATPAIELATVLPLAADGCLDHAVRELGMSAKREPEARRWVIAPQFLHPTMVPGGQVRVAIVRGEAGVELTMTAELPPRAVAQAEVRERLEAMVAKTAQVCGTLQPVIACRTGCAR